MSNAVVEKVQEALKIAGFFKGEVDGEMSPELESAFQGFCFKTGCSTFFPLNESGIQKELLDLLPQGVKKSTPETEEDESDESDDSEADGEVGRLLEPSASSIVDEAAFVENNTDGTQKVGVVSTPTEEETTDAPSQEAASEDIEVKTDD